MSNWFLQFLVTREGWKFLISPFFWRVEGQLEIVLFFKDMRSVCALDDILSPPAWILRVLTAENLELKKPRSSNYKQSVQLGVKGLDMLLYFVCLFCAHTVLFFCLGG